MFTCLLDVSDSSDLYPSHALFPMNLFCCYFPYFGYSFLHFQIVYITVHDYVIMKVGCWVEKETIMMKMDSIDHFATLISPNIC